ncbi:hypothetical protein RLIN73S_00790 [Rhodanobacter lindaniclasticus]
MEAEYGELGAYGVVSVNLALGAQRAVHLVGRHVQEAEAFAGGAFEAAPVVARAFEQAQGADHVGLHELGRAVDRAVDVRFGGEIHDGIGLVFGQQLRHQRAVADVALYENVTRITLQRGQRIEVAGIGELVQVDHAQAVGHRLQHEIRADETGAAGDQQGPGMKGWVVHCTFFGVIWANIRQRMVRPWLVLFDGKRQARA